MIVAAASAWPGGWPLPSNHAVLAVERAFFHHQPTALFILLCFFQMVA
jgi:hypothetical protein